MNESRFERAMVRTLLLIAFIAVIASVESRAAERLSPDDPAAIRHVIHRQIEAFRRDDARAAFALASPGIQSQFRTPERFMSAVQVTYAPISRSAGINFLELWTVENEVVQIVQLPQSSGVVWFAYYTMQRQGDGTWKTSGCLLLQTRSVAL